MIVAEVTPTDDHEQWLYRCPNCGREVTITVEALT